MKVLKQADGVTHAHGHCHGADAGHKDPDVIGNIGFVIWDRREVDADSIGFQLRGGDPGERRARDTRDNNICISERGSSICIDFLGPAIDEFQRAIDVCLLYTSDAADE